jgi:hypothetical protein
MMRHVRLLLVALLVAFSAVSAADAAQKKVVRHRPRHSTRVAAGATATTGTRASASRRRVAAKKKARASASRTAAKKSAARARATARRRPATKPR